MKYNKHPLVSLLSTLQSKDVNKCQEKMKLQDGRWKNGSYDIPIDEAHYWMYLFQEKNNSLGQNDINGEELSIEFTYVVKDELLSVGDHIIHLFV